MFFTRFFSLCAFEKVINFKFVDWLQMVALLLRVKLHMFEKL